MPDSTESELQSLQGALPSSNAIKGLGVLAELANAKKGDQPSKDVQTIADAPLVEPPKDKSPTVTTPPAQPQNPWTQLADSVAKQYADTIFSEAPEAAGVGNYQTQANASAEADLGASQTSPMAQYLNSLTSAAASQNTGVQAAEQGEEAAALKGSAGILQGVKNLGAAEDQEMQSAPYQQLLQSLAAEVPYQLSKGYSLPGWNANQEPNWLNQAMYYSGATSSMAGGGTTTANSGSLPSPALAAGQTGTQALTNSLTQNETNTSQGQ